MDIFHIMDFVRVDVARELYEDRQQALVRYQHKIENRRSRQALREQQLIVTAVEKKAREKEKVEWLQKYNRNLKNQSGSRYDILTLQYSNASEQSHCEDSSKFKFTRF